MANDGLQRLAPLVGDWRMETSLPGSAGVRARTSFEWALGGAFLLQRVSVDVAEARDALCVLAADPATGGFTQHYFDSRGVVRLYAMTLDDEEWTLHREVPDVTPLEFSQRFIGHFEDRGRTIRGRWESRALGDTEWAHDFDLTYVKG